MICYKIVLSGGVGRGGVVEGWWCHSEVRVLDLEVRRSYVGVGLGN